MTSFSILLTMTAQKHKLYKNIINLYFCILTQHLEWFWLYFSLCVFDDFRLFVSFHIFHRFVVFIHFCFKQHFSVTWTLLPASRNSQSLLLSFFFLLVVLVSCFKQCLSLKTKKNKKHFNEKLFSFQLFDRNSYQYISTTLRLNTFYCKHFQELKI